MIVLHDLFGTHYLDKKTLAQTDSIACKEVVMVGRDYKDIFQCGGYIIDYSRYCIRLYCETGYTELAIDGTVVLNNGLVVNNKLKIPRTMRDIIFSLPMSDDRYVFKIKVQDITNHKSKLIKLKDLCWIKDDTMYQQYRRKLVLRG